jgi:2-phosphosulfolactate phosphatase
METIVNENQRRVEVCVSPLLFPTYYNNPDCVVVVIDVFRATSAICAAFENGVKSIIPVLTVEEAKEYQSKGFLAAAERNGQIVKGFDIGNSPFSYMNDNVIGRDVVLSTTNGTKAISYAKEANEIIVGSFLNLKAICNYLESQKKDVILLCAGWKDRYNLEDTLFAGAVVYYLSKNKLFTGLSDSSLAAKSMYIEAKGNLGDYLKESSHRNRLAKLNLEKDIDYCLQESIIDLVPKLKGKHLIVEY